VLRECLYRDLARRSCQDTSRREFVPRSCQETSYRDLCTETLHRDLWQRSCLEVSYVDLDMGALVQSLCKDLIKRSCQETSYRKLVYRDLLKKSADPGRWQGGARQRKNRTCKPAQAATYCQRFSIFATCCIVLSLLFRPCRVPQRLKQSTAMCVTLGARSSMFWNHSQKVTLRTANTNATLSGPFEA